MQQLFTAVAKFSASMSKLGLEQTSSMLAALRGDRPLALGDLPRGMLRSALVGLRGSVLAAGPWVGGRAAVDLSELGNKLLAFEDFRFAEQAIAGTSGLARQVAASRRLPPWRALWVLEGLGFQLGMAGVGLRQVDNEIATAGELLPLHTGMGLALARRRLDDLRSPAGAMALRDLVQVCRTSSRPGYSRAVFEALGLIVIGLAPAAITRLDATLAAELPARRGTFWHGLGRGLYFSPRRLLPGSGKAAFDEALRLTGSALAGTAKAPAEVARANALSGLFWATTLVNLTAPAVLAELLDQLDAQLLQLPPDLQKATRCGIASALSLWAYVVGREALLESFLAYQPAAGPPARRWRQWVLEPVASKLARLAELSSLGPGVLFDLEGTGGDFGENL